MATAVAVLASLAFIGWIIYRAVKVKSVKAHMVSYGVAVVTGVYAYANFLAGSEIAGNEWRTAALARDRGGPTWMRS